MYVVLFLVRVDSIPAKHCGMKTIARSVKMGGHCEVLANNVLLHVEVLRTFSVSQTSGLHQRDMIGHSIELGFLLGCNCIGSEVLHLFFPLPKILFHYYISGV